MSSRLLALWMLVGCLVGVEPLRLDGTRRELTPADADQPLIIGTAGAVLHATEPVELRAPIHLERTGNGGLDVTVVARSLRSEIVHDLRGRPDIAGRRRDASIDLPQPAAGTAAERRRFGVAGTDTDWDNFTLQWDGVLRIPAGGVDLATSSDDGSRVCIDRDGDGTLAVDEWGSNGWGSGQGMTQRTVHEQVPPGVHAIRVQCEDGGGPNGCRLLWRGEATGHAWQVVPADAFLACAVLTLEGPVSLRAPLNGEGFLVCTGGVRLFSRPDVRQISINGTVSAAADLDLRAIPVYISADSRLDLAGHVVQLDQVSGSGDIALGGGTVHVPTGRWPLRLRGPGTFAAAPGETRFAEVDPVLTITGSTFSVRDDVSCRARLAGAAPLSTICTIAEDAPGDQQLDIELTVPTDAPPDLGFGICRTDPIGRWFQCTPGSQLTPGHHRLTIGIGGGDAFRGEGHGARWSPQAAGDCRTVGIFLYATRPGSTPVDIRTRLSPRAAAPMSAIRLTDFARDGWDGTVSHGRTGERWELHLRPTPYPADPFDPALFRVDLEVTEPDGTVRRFAGFHDQPVQRHDEGNRETFTASGAARFTVRFRPRQPGAHRLRLLSAGSATRPTTADLGTLLVTGEPGDGLVRVDRSDPRFFSVDGRFIWPLGHNLHSTYDTRSASALGTALTVDRGSFVREALLKRLAAHGGTGCETWMSAWNLGLEWNPRWPGYLGTGRYHDGHAWAIDAFLDQAERLGVWVNLTIYNHGMARDGSAIEMEWPYHPYNIANGGWLDSPAGLFTDARAFAYQQRLFRYIGARYGDSPALLGWKLWAEVDLAHAPKPAIAEWHERASAAMIAADPYGHGVTTHWCGDWRNPDRRITGTPTIGYLCIDAYHGDGTLIADLLCQSLRDPMRPGLGLWGDGKPLVVTEFGGNWNGTTQERMEIEHAIGPWAGLVSGHAASPMLWWLEWIDQGDRYGVYRAVSRFMEGEDLRGREAACVAPRIGQGLWCRAWRNGDRWLGYTLDPAWGVGNAERTRSGITVTLDADAVAGRYLMEWWDAEQGIVVGRDERQHAGGPLQFPLPEFRRHLAWKAMRQAD